MRVVAALLILSCGPLCLGSAPASAALLAVSGYDMANGDGVAHGGSLNYWDAGYSACGPGDCTTDDAPLSGGIGKLADGVVASLPWYSVSNLAGTGQYVGWRNVSPTITFHFATAQSVHELKLYVDNSHVGGVTAPSAVVVGGTTYANPAWTGATVPEVIDIAGLDLSGSDIAVQLVDPTEWVFLSEAQFFGDTPIPEPTALPLLAAAVLALAAATLFRAPQRRLRR